jgi:hypothetical protein
MYNGTKGDFERIERNFKYYTPEGDQRVRYDDIRDASKALATLLVHSCPPSRELALAITALEEAVMWANAAIARNEAHD